MCIYFVIILSHSIRKSLQDICMFTWVNSRNYQVINKWKWLHCQSFVQILFLDILFDCLSRNWMSINISSAKKHSRCMIILIIDNVHCIKSKIFLIDFFLLYFRCMKNYYLLTFIILNFLLFPS